MLPDLDDLYEQLSTYDTTEDSEATHLALAGGHRVGKVLERLLEVVDLFLVKARHFGLGELRDIVKVVSRVEHLALSLVAKDEP